MVAWLDLNFDNLKNSRDIGTLKTGGLHRPRRLVCPVKGCVSVFHCCTSTCTLSLAQAGWLNEKDSDHNLWLYRRGLLWETSRKHNDGLNKPLADWFCVVLLRPSKNLRPRSIQFHVSLYGQGSAKSTLNQARTWRHKLPSITFSKSLRLLSSKYPKHIHSLNSHQEVTNVMANELDVLWATAPHTLLNTLEEKLQWRRVCGIARLHETFC